MRSFRNRMLKSALGSNFQIVAISQTMAGDICFHDKITKQKIFVRGKFRKTDFPLDLYTPIGVVFVPGIHNVYGTNTCCIMSLPDMHCSYPTTGSIDTQSIKNDNIFLSLSIVLACGQSRTVTPPLPQADKCGYKIVGIQAERGVEPLTEEYPHSCQTCSDTDHPHEILLADFQDNVNHACQQGKYLHEVH